MPDVPDYRDYDVLLFDCDGVVLDSNTIKSSALGEAVSDYGDALRNQFVAYHRKFGGVSRYEKFRYFLKEMAHDYSPSRYDQLLSRLSDLVEEKLVAAPLVNGALELLDRSAEQERYIVSGGDQAELNTVFRRRGLARHFAAILGSPTPKTQHCEHLRDTMGEDQKGLLFGDSRLDHEAATTGKFDFVFISGHTDFDNWKQYCRDHDLSHFTDFQHYLASIRP